MIAENIAQCIGNTPLVHLHRIEKETGVQACLLAKIEGMNPAGSAKDRVALNMLDEAERKGVIGPGATLIEPTSGNTGIGLAALAALRGYKAIFTMPDTMSPERQKLLKAYGAKIVLTPGAEGMGGAVKKAEELHREIENSWIPSQFENPDNPDTHYKSTGPEIWQQTQGKVDILVAGVGTGGTLSGTGKYLKEKDPGIKAVAVEPATSPLLSQGKSGPHGLQGIGANFIPDTLDRSIYDEILCITDEEAYTYGRMIAQKEGILVGITSGAALCAAVKLAKREENAGKNIIMIFPDTGERYLSTPLFGE